MTARRTRHTIADYLSAKTSDYVTCAAVESARKIGNLVEMFTITEEVLAKYD
jgi:hypothetical protein